MTTSRTRKAEWIEKFGAIALENAVSEILAREGPDFLTDDQLEQVVSKIAAGARKSNSRAVRIATTNAASH